ncbi:Uncharacterised protein [Burkholderia pseudomallei]|nr:Uncharacterised protein [Burkholderia pseudomallei]CAJ4492542.1 Uncharacterised protein [Burkholderia pseudomallei]CAJ5356748.1 Uncharacterised protein [Burkholderia pseudomallei]CAJ5859908.1 Uncharacterised protein [Burkholderia pseudomallei]CAJ6449136.1 Uncharacterised protein [Burkholderia pseudomallei]
MPTNAIATPVDSVASRPSASTALSVTSTSAPPASAASGTSAPSLDAFAPRICRIRFGAIRPMYDSGPAMLTATLAKPTATTVPASRVASTRTPAAAAASSPSASGSSGRITSGSAASGATSHRSASRSPAAPGWYRLPLAHSDAPTTVCSKNASSSVVTAENSSMQTLPARMRRSGVARQPPAAADTHAAAASPQTNRSGTDAWPASAGTSIAAISPSCAPPVMPSRSGAASGLRVSDCSSAPAAARQPPATSAAATRGAARSNSMICASCAASPPAGAASHARSSGASRIAAVTTISATSAPAIAPTRPGAAARDAGEGSGARPP